jgi:hypothetical protein
MPMHARLRPLFDFLEEVGEKPFYDEGRECLVDRTSDEEISNLETEVLDDHGTSSYSLTGRLGSLEAWIRPGTSDGISACILTYFLAENGDRRKGFKFGTQKTRSGETELLVHRLIPIPSHDADKIGWYIALRSEYCIFLDNLPGMIDDIHRQCGGRADDAAPDVKG